MEPNNYWFTDGGNTYLQKRMCFSSFFSFFLGAINAPAKEIQ